MLERTNPFHELERIRQDWYQAIQFKSIFLRNAINDNPTQLNEIIKLQKISNAMFDKFQCAFGLADMNSHYSEKLINEIIKLRKEFEDFNAKIEAYIDNYKSDFTSLIKRKNAIQRRADILSIPLSTERAAYRKDIKTGLNIIKELNRLIEEAQTDINNVSVKIKNTNEAYTWLNELTLVIEKIRPTLQPLMDELNYDQSIINQFIELNKEIELLKKQVHDTSQLECLMEIKSKLKNLKTNALEMIFYDEKHPEYVGFKKEYDVISKSLAQKTADLTQKEKPLKIAAAREEPMIVAPIISELNKEEPKLTIELLKSLLTNRINRFADYSKKYQENIKLPSSRILRLFCLFKTHGEVGLNRAIKHCSQFIGFGSEDEAISKQGFIRWIHDQLKNANIANPDDMTSQEFKSVLLTCLSSLQQRARLDVVELKNNGSNLHIHSYTAYVMKYEQELKANIRSIFSLTKLPNTEEAFIQLMPSSSIDHFSSDEETKRNFELYQNHYTALNANNAQDCWRNFRLAS